MSDEAKPDNKNKNFSGAEIKKNKLNSENFPLCPLFHFIIQLFFDPSSINARYAVLIAEDGHGKNPQLTTFLHIIVEHCYGVHPFYL